MANHFVAVPADVLEKWLQDQKFERTVQRQEVVYVRKSQRNPDVQLKVYTSVKDGQAQVRNAGKDAIRVCAVFDNGRKSFGVGKFQPVLRVTSVESVLTRLKERLVEAAKRANEWISQNEAQFAARDAQRGGPPTWAQNRAPRQSEPVLLDADFEDPCSEPPPALFAGE